MIILFRGGQIAGRRGRDQCVALLQKNYDGTSVSRQNVRALISAEIKAL